MIKDADIQVVLGRRGSGKSTLLKRLLEPEKRVIVFDVQREYGEAGFLVVETLSGLREAMAAGWNSGFRVAYVPPRRGRLEAFEQVAELILRAQNPYTIGTDQRQILFVVEEINVAYPNRLNAAPAFTECILQGRHYGINLIGVSQRPTLIAPNFRGNAETWYVFPLDSHDDRMEVIHKIGPEWKEKLRNLQNHNYFCIASGAVIEAQNPPLNGRK